MNEIEQLLRVGFRLTWRPAWDEFDAYISFDQQFLMYLVYDPRGEGQTEYYEFGDAWAAFHQAAINQENAA